MKYRADIDGLRAVAVLPVILFHLGVPGFRGGFVGVDVFFVISGYLITSLIAPEIEQNRFSILAFYDRRIRRILPALFTVMACTVPFAVVLLLPSPLRKYAETVVAMSLFASNLLFWHQAGYFDDHAHEKPLLHTWSLAVEEQFYIFFPLLLLLLWRVARGRVRPVLVVLAVLSLALSTWTIMSDPSGAFYAPQSRAWELLLGCLLALSPQRSLGGMASNILSALGLALIFYAVFAFSSTTPFPGLNALFPTIGAALIIRTANDSTWFAGPLLRANPTVLMGKISYSAYLWHWPLIVFATYYLVRDLRPPEMVMIGVLTLGLSGASWSWIEQPARQIRVDRHKIFAAAGCAMALLIPLGLGGYVAHGFPDRFATDPEPPGLLFDDLETCFLYRKPVDIWSEAQCTFPSPLKSPAPKVFLWGDSFAAQYAPGLRALQETVPFTLVHASMSACPPLPNAQTDTHIGTAACEQFNEQIFALIHHEKPDLVVFSGRWDGRHGDLTYRTAIGFVLAQMKADGIPVLVVGESPVYAAAVPQMYSMSRLRGVHDNWHNPQNDFGMDSMLKAVSLEHGAQFFSPHERLCIESRCQISDGQLFYWDAAHFSVHGSTMMARAMLPQIVAALKDRGGLSATDAGTAMNGDIQPTNGGL